MSQYLFLGLLDRLSLKSSTVTLRWFLKTTELSFLSQGNSASTIVTLPLQLLMVKALGLPLMTSRTSKISGSK
jgi:hypothetical protein